MPGGGASRSRPTPTTGDASRADSSTPSGAAAPGGRGLRHRIRQQPRAAGPSERGLDAREVRPVDGLAGGAPELLVRVVVGEPKRSEPHRPARDVARDEAATWV